MSVIDFTDIERLHSEAMELAAKADQKRASGDIATATSLIRQAFEREQGAAFILRDKYDIEPSRSVLFRSAASLAYEGGLNQDAERLIAFGLIGNPPKEIAEELRDLYEQVNLQRHFNFSSSDASPAEIRMTFVGKVVGYGSMPATDYLRRIEVAQTLLVRNHERLQNVPFRVSGRPKRDLLDDCELFITAPIAASFSVSLRYASSTPQQSLSFIAAPIQLAHEFMRSIDLFRRGKRRLLKRHFNNDTKYLDNFVALARQLAPDGNRITNIGFSLPYEQSRTPVILDSSAANSCHKKPGDSSESVRIITGILVHAEKSKKNQIGLQTESEKIQLIQVPPSLLNDIVRPLWDQQVEVRVRDKDGVLTLEEIKDSEVR